MSRVIVVALALLTSLSFQAHAASKYKKAIEKRSGIAGMRDYKQGIATHNFEGVKISKTGTVLSTHAEVGQYGETKYDKTTLTYSKHGRNKLVAVTMPSGRMLSSKNIHRFQTRQPDGKFGKATRVTVEQKIAIEDGVPVTSAR